MSMSISSISNSLSLPSLKKIHFIIYLFVPLFLLLYLVPISIADAQTNLVTNGNFTTIQSGTPLGWTEGQWGNNSAQFSFTNAGVSNTNGGHVVLNSRTSGDVKWAFDHVQLLPNTGYTYKNTYKADTSSYVTVEYKHTNGTYSYVDIDTPPAAQSFTPLSVSFTTPSDVESASVFHLINEEGSLTIDNVSLTKTTSSSDPSNLIANNSLEVSGPSGGPLYWNEGQWGNNSATFQYPHSDAQEGVASGRIILQNYQSGDAKFYFDDIDVSGGETFIFRDYYKSNVPTYVTARYTYANGALSYIDIGQADPASNWSEFETMFEVPAGVVSLTIFHLIKENGSLAVDNYYLSPHTSSDLYFPEGMVTLAFDDGWNSAYDIVYPYLNSKGMKGTFYIVSERMSDRFPGYITSAEVQEIHNAGHEIGAHTVTHANLTSLSLSEAEAEITNSRNALFALGITPVSTFAYPFGAYNSSIASLVEGSGFTNARTTNGGTNTRVSDPHTLSRFGVQANTSLASVQNYINEVQQEKTWGIITFHDIGNTGSPYAVSSATFQNIIDYLAQQNIKVVTMEEAIAIKNNP